MISSALASVSTIADLREGVQANDLISSIAEQKSAVGSLAGTNAISQFEQSIEATAPTNSPDRVFEQSAWANRSDVTYNAQGWTNTMHTSLIVDVYL